MCAQLRAPVVGFVFARIERDCPIEAGFGADRITEISLDGCSIEMIFGDVVRSARSRG